ncbi:activator of Hsp90 ATPase-like protein [Glaciihabitans tibetensis]|uniref:Activator of Hsp90 ATPase-like protein n=1 Tax=Glaciihabitans tibetensis TaxID=1266600 RepID=A0A2T0VCI0_9MICO|nr:SRPBCC domain-containing protein [Glaciihabitans tibetensis]PRY67886.1 activator of Hsp90 ATPase-like protein [Glaciihabitans tibetensis]
MTLRWPNGRVIRDSDGLELIVERAIEAPASEVWEWLTAPSRLSQWIGSWEGEPAVGGTLSFTMSAEQGAAPEPLTVLICDPGVHFLCDMGENRWRIGFSLTEVQGLTLVFFTQRMAGAEQAGSIGPGWEYYLDRMIAARSSLPLPVWADYYPAFSRYYARVAATPS